MKKSAQKLPTISPMQAFRLRHGLSYQDLSDVCDNAPNCSKSQISRLLNNQVEDKQMESEMRQILAQKLPSLLFAMGFTSSQIDAELSAIFNNKEYQPMISARTTLNKSAQEWFGFTDDPFEKRPSNIQEVFVSDDFQSVLDSAIDAITYRKFIAITGTHGSGKTILRMAIEAHVEQNPHLLLISPETFDMSKLTASAITRKMMETFGEFKIPRSPVAQKDKLTSLFVQNANRRTALLIDEVHRVNKETVPTFKNFYEMIRHGFSQYLGIILIGQPQFESILTEMPEIKKRVKIVEMPPFEKNAVGYLQHRLKIVGGDIKTLFDESALETITKHAQTPLQLGNIVNKAFLTAKDHNDHCVYGSSFTSENGFAESNTESKVLRKRA